MSRPGEVEAVEAVRALWDGSSRSIELYQEEAERVVAAVYPLIAQAALAAIGECDDRLDGLSGHVHYCARSFGHRGPHSTDRKPGATSLTWRRFVAAERSSSPVGGTQ